MKKTRKIFKILVIALAGFVLVIALITTAFVNMSPQFGATPTKADEQNFLLSGHYENGKFQNELPTTLGMGFRKTVSIMWDFFFAQVPGKEPDGPLPVRELDSASVAERSEDIARLTWFGHSACFLEIDGRKILIDPMLGQHAGPLPLVSPQRYNRNLPLEIESMPFIDVVLISHDHYDHLDHGSIVKLKDKVGHFYVPLGVGSHLASWGVERTKITELNWWEETTSAGFTFVCAPARHFSGRGFINNKTLWSSWIILSSKKRIYFSGDSGYGPHFKEIGTKYGPFDFALMECGQYNTEWRQIHMMPEETVQATLDVQGKLLLPIHWGAFTLAMHPWTDPIIRVTAEAKKFNVPITTPVIGQVILLDSAPIGNSRWWEGKSEFTEFKN
jgi:L-ascorbate metabolism protein UlaG (beta-lactamase superfamily)